MEKYIFKCNEATICVQAENKMQAIRIFRKQFELTFEKDWTVSKVHVEVNTNGIIREF